MKAWRDTPALRRVLTRMRRVARGMSEKPTAAERTKAWRAENQDRIQRYNDQRREAYNAAVAARRADPSTLIGAKRAARDAARHGGSCISCGCEDTYALEFVHRSGERKIANLSEMVLPKTYTLDVFKAELAKCDLVCASCRRVALAARKRAQAERARRKKFLDADPGQEQSASDEPGDNDA